MPQIFKRISDGQLRYRPSGVDTQVTDIVTRAATTVSTTGNIDNLDLTGYSELRMTNASDSTIRGIVAGVAGERKTIVSLGAGHVFLAHQNASSSAANRLINFVTSGNTPLAAGVGVAEIEYDATTARWRLVSHTQGAAITVTFDAANFTANGTMTWTVDSGDQVTFTYLIVGRTMEVVLALEGYTTGGVANTQLRVTIPGSYTVPTGTTQQLHWTFDNVTAKTGLILAVGGETYLRNYRDITLASNWELVTNNGFIRGSIRFSIS